MRAQVAVARRRVQVERYRWRISHSSMVSARNTLAVNQISLQFTVPKEHETLNRRIRDVPELISLVDEPISLFYR